MRRVVDQPVPEAPGYDEAKAAVLGKLTMRRCPVCSSPVFVYDTRSMCPRKCGTFLFSPVLRGAGDQWVFNYRWSGWNMRQ